MISLFVNELPLLSAFNDRDRMIVDASVNTCSTEISSVRSYVFSTVIPTMTASRIILTNLPTSSTGLPVGTVWNSGGTLRIVT